MDVGFIILLFYYAVITRHDWLRHRFPGDTAAGGRASRLGRPGLLFPHHTQQQLLFLLSVADDEHDYISNVMASESLDGAQ